MSNNANKATLFKNVKVGTAFTPVKPDPAAGRIYVKRVNGVCPRVDGSKDEGIFWPEDRVNEVKIPEKILKQYR